MDCKEAEEHFEPYLLGALDSEEMSLMDSHLETCPRCSLSLQADGETVARLAFSVPQLEVPASVKDLLLARIEADERASPRPQTQGRLSVFWPFLGRAVQPYSAKAAAAVLVLGLVSGGFWFNNRLSEVSRENEELDGQVKAAAERDVEVVDMVTKQRELTYEALRMSTMKGNSVNMLWSPEQPSATRGMMMISYEETEGLLVAFDLPPLRENRVYQMWFITRSGHKYDAGILPVDSTGYGQAVIIPVIPFGEMDAIQITAEPAGGSKDPTGTGVLRGDL